ncbi:hypothetical protein ACVFI8_19585 [Agarivorans sp. MS3-6]|uniref:hypothetical protein n=1 Tax=Agarivorans sp. TSD2052 TaxID=2937286 RepID=UPI00200F4ABB|nr:hypothetical protein [Agarivorans sp. TSD2052]UPW16958.1 hypothetical protein M0C34_11945 [Agarivorans sp. TSD2052]
MIATCWRFFVLLKQLKLFGHKSLILFLIISVSNPLHANVWVVGHATHQFELNTKNIRSIFSLRQKNWPNGQAIEIVVMNSNDELHKQFCLSALKLFPYQLTRIWERQIYTGTAIAPTEVDSEQAMLQKILDNPNAIGYSSQEVNNEELHSILVE